MPRAAPADGVTDALSHQHLTYGIAADAKMISNALLAPAGAAQAVDALGCGLAEPEDHANGDHQRHQQHPQDGGGHDGKCSCQLEQRSTAGVNAH